MAVARLTFHRPAHQYVTACITGEVVYIDGFPSLIVLEIGLYFIQPLDGAVRLYAVRCPLPSGYNWPGCGKNKTAAPTSGIILLVFLYYLLHVVEN